MSWLFVDFASQISKERHMFRCYRHINRLTEKNVKNHVEWILFFGYFFVWCGLLRFFVLFTKYMQVDSIKFNSYIFIPEPSSTALSSTLSCCRWGGSSAWGSHNWQHSRHHWKYARFLTHVVYCICPMSITYVATLRALLR